MTQPCILASSLPDFYKDGKKLNSLDDAGLTPNQLDAVGNIINGSRDDPTPKDMQEMRQSNKAAEIEINRQLKEAGIDLEVKMRIKPGVSNGEECTKAIKEFRKMPPRPNLGPMV